MADLREIKMIIKGILGSSKKQMLQKDLIHEFSSTVGYKIPYDKFGFRNCEDFLRSLKDTCVLQGSGPYAQVTPILTPDSAHIVQMIARQRSTNNPRDKYKPKNQAIIIPTESFSQVAAKPAPVPVQNRISPSQYSQPRYSSPVRAVPPLMSINPFLVHGVPVFPPKFAPAMQFRPCPPLSVHKLKHNQRGSVQNRPQMNNGLSSNRTNQTIVEKSNHLTTNTVNNSHIVNNNNIETASAVENPERREVVDGRDTNAKQEKATLKPLSIIKNINQEVDEGLTQEVSNRVELDYKINYRIPKVIQENLKQLMQQHPEGVWVRKIQDIYRETFKQNLEFQCYGYTSLVEMCLTMSYIFRYKQFGAGDGKLYHVDATIPEDDEAMMELSNSLNKVVEQVQEAPPHIPMLIPEENDNYPKFVMLPGDKIPVAQVPTCEEKLYIKIYIEEVYDLSKFWFSLAENEDIREAKSKEIENYYNDNYRKYAISQQQLVKGLFVIVFKGHNFYNRAVVVRFDKSMVTVFCVDYGTIEKTTLENLYFMHKNIGDFPRQAIRARLAGLQPPVKQSQWCRNAAYRLVELVQMKLLYGSVQCTDDSQGDLIHDLILCDASGKEDIFIQDILIAEGFAIPMTQEQAAPNAGMYGDLVPIVNDLHLYPSFIELELAVVPSASDMRRLIALNIPLPGLYPLYFKQKKAEVSLENEQHPLKQFMQRRLCPQLQSSASSTSPVSRKSDGDVASVSPVSNDDDGLEIKQKVSLVPPYRPLVNNVVGQTSPILNENMAQHLGQGDSAGNFLSAFGPQNVYEFSPPRTPLSPAVPLRPQLGVSMGLTSPPGLPPLGGKACLSPAPPRLAMSQFSPPCGNSPVMYQELLHPNNRMLKHMTASLCSTVQRMLMPYVNQAPACNYNTQPFKKKYVLKADILGRPLHIVRIMKLPCVLTNEVQYVFTGKVDNLLLRRYVSMTEVVISTLPLDSINEQFMLELARYNLISDRNRLQYTRLDCLEEFVSCLTNTECKVPNFEAMVSLYADDSPTWNVT